MRKRMQQRVALFLSFAMAFTSVDSSVLVAASDVTEVVSEETHDHASEEAFLAEEAQPDNAEATAISEEVESVTEADLGDVEEEVILGDPSESEGEQVIGDEPETSDVVEETVIESATEVAALEENAEGVTISSITGAPAKEEFITELDTWGISNNTMLEITYSDGSVQTYTIYNDQFVDKYGTVIPFYLKNTEDGNTWRYGHGNSMYQGTWELVCEVNGEAVQTDVTYNVTDVANAEIPVLELGTVSIHSGYSCYNWYQFTAPETGKYYFQKIGGFSVKKKASIGVEGISNGNGDFRATAGETYYLGFQGTVWNQGTEQYENDWQTEFARSEVEITSIDNVIPAKDLYLANIETYFVSGTKVTITYSNGESKTVAWNGNSVYSDGRGNTISMMLKTEDSSVGYNQGQTLKAGDYAAFFTVDGKEKGNSGYIYHVKNAKDADLPNLTLGENEINSSSLNDLCNWYQFTAPATGKYWIDKRNDLRIYTGDGTYVTSFKATAGTTYYIGFRGAIDGSNYTWTANLSSVIEVTEITDIVPGKTETIAGFSNLANGTTFVIHYSDGTSQAAKIVNGTYTDSQGNYIEAIPKRENDNTLYGTWTGLPTGRYAVDLRLDGTVVASTDYIYHVIKPKEMDLPELNVGSNQITSGQNDTYNWYRFTAPTTGKYWFDKISMMEVYVDVKDELQQRSWSNNNFQVEAGKTYYIGFRGSYWDPEIGGQTYEWTTNLQLSKEITKIADITPKWTEYVSGLDNLVSYGTTFHIYYSDGSVKRATVNSNYYNDGLGNGINMRLISKEDGREYWDWSNLPAGNYALAFYVNKQLAKTDFVYQVKSVEDTEIGELTEGENQIVSSTDYNIPNWYQFVPQHSGNYRINPVSSLSIRKKTENGMESIYSNGSTVSMTAGTTYYLGFSGMWNSGYEWNITIEQIPVITDIQVVKTGKEKYIADLDQGIIRNTELKISYDNGEPAIVKIPYGPYFSDNYGNNINAELIKDSKSYNVYGTVPAGSYTLKCRVNNDQTYECKDIYQVADISEVDLPELKPGTVEITSSEDYDNPNWYRFTAPKTKRYVISKYSSIKVKYLSEDGTFEDVSMFDGAFKATYNQTYYIGFYYSIWDDEEEEDIYTWTTELRETNYLTYISVTAKKTKFYAGYEQNHVLLSNIKVRYDGGNLQGYTEWDDWSNIDGQGNGCNVYLTDEEEGQYDVSEALSAGTYTVHIQYREDSSVQDDYIIQVENEPAPFLGDEVNVTELSLDEKYRVSLDEDKVCEWFSYTPEKDRIVQFQSFGRKDTYAELYDASGNMIADNDEGGERSNFSIRETLEAGQTYYFKARLYRFEGKASFTVSLTEQQSIQSLEVVEHDLNPVYLKNSDLPEPNVLLKAIYSNEESDTFYKKDKYNNEVWGEVLDASGNQVDTLEEVGTYTYQVRYGEADEQTVKVGEFQVVSLADYANQVVEENQEQQMDAADTHVMRYQFTVTDAGIYQLNANVSFKNLRVYDTKENEVELSWHRKGYTCWAALQEGTYYVVADLNNGVEKLTVSVKKTVLPNSVEAVYSGETLVAGLDSLESWNLATRVEYTDDTQAWIYGSNADSYGNYFEYEVTNPDKEYSEWGIGETLPEGTYTVKPVVFRTGTSRWDDTVPENQMLGEILTEDHIKSTTVKVVKPDIAAMTPITAGQDVNVTGSAGRYFYTFTPETDGTYTFAYEGAIQGNTFFCDNRDTELRERGTSINAKAGVTYIVVAEKYKDYQFRIVEKGTDTGETVTKKIQSVEICSEMEYVLEESVYQNRDQLYLCVTYEDGTIEYTDIPVWLDGREDVYDDYGNKFQYTPAEDEVVEEEEERYLTFGVEYPGGSCSTQIPIRDVKEAAIEVTTENAAEAEAASYFKFVPEETGEYIFKTTAQKWGAELGRFTGNKNFTDRNGYENDGTVIQQAVASLQRGKAYYFSVTEYRENNSMPYTLSVSKIEKQVTDLKIVEVPEGYAAYAGIGVPDYNWLKAEVTYSDGSQEIVTEGRASDTGRSLRVNRSYCVNTDTYRVEVQYGKYRAHVDLPVKAWDYTGVLKTGVAAAGKAGEHISMYSFTPAEKGIYRFSVTGIEQYAFDVYNSETQKMILSRYGTFTLEAGTTYNVAVYNYYSEEGEYTVTVNKAGDVQEHIHTYVEDKKDATCWENGYTQKKCSGCGEVLEGSYKEIPALGHNWENRVDKEPTCTEAGLQVKYCTRCGMEEEAEVLPALGHELEVTESKEATCTEEGNNAYWICSRCDMVYADEDGKKETTVEAQIIQALGHDWQEKVLQNPTETEPGLKAEICTRCDAEKEDSRVEIPALGVKEGTIESISVATTKTEYIANEEASFTREAILRIQYTNATMLEVGLKPYTSTYTDEYGNTILWHLEKIGEEGTSYYVGNTLKAGEYAVCFSTEPKLGQEQIKTASYPITVKNLSDMSLPELHTGMVELRDDDEGPIRWNWYRFTAPRTARYKVMDCVGMKVYVCAEDGTITYVESADHTFLATEDNTYYLYFIRPENSESATWTTELREVDQNAVEKMELISTEQLFYATGRYQDYLQGKVRITYADGREEIMNIYDTDTDSAGNIYDMYLTLASDPEKRINGHNNLKAGDYLAHIELEDDRTISVQYPITVKEEPSPFNGEAEAIKVEPDKNYDVSLDEMAISQWFSYTPEKDTQLIYQSMGEEDTYGMLYTADGKLAKYNDDGGESANFKITERLNAGEIYYFKAMMYSIGSKGRFQISFTEIPEINAGEENQQLQVKNGVVDFQFSVEEEAIYQIHANTRFSSFRLYDESDNRVELSGLSSGYTTYAVLPAGKYRATAKVNLSVTNLKMTVKKVVLPVELTAYSSQKTLIAGVDALNEDLFSMNVTYENGDSLLVAGRNNDSYDNRFSYEVEGSRWTIGQTVPVGTYTVKPVAVRTGSAMSKDNQILNNVLKDSNKHGVTVKSVKPDTSAMTEISLNDWIVTGKQKGRYFYLFTADESDTYKIEEKNGLKCDARFYLEKEDRLDYNGGRITLNQGKTCIVVVDTYAEEQSFRIIKNNSGGTVTPDPGPDPGTEKVFKEIQIQQRWSQFVEEQSVQKAIKAEIVFTDGTREEVELNRTYMLEGYTVSSNYSWIYQDGKEYVKVTVSCNGTTEEKLMQVYALSDVATQLELDSSVNGTITSTDKYYYIFKAEESGEYLIRLTTPQNSAEIGEDYWGEFTDVVNSRTGDGSYFEQISVTLEAGEDCCFEISTDGARNGAEYTLMVQKPDEIQNLEITEMPEGFAFHSYLWEEDLDWLTMQVSYADGSSENVSLDEMSRTGRICSITSAQWINEKTFRVYVGFGRYMERIDIPGKEWDEVTVLTRDVASAVTSAGRVTPFVFAPDETGAYSFTIDRATKNSEVHVWKAGSWEKVDRKYEQFELEEGTTYRVAVYTYGTDFAITPVKESDEKCHHELTEIAAEEATCDEPGTKGYWICGKCNKVFADAEGKTETTVEARVIPVLGHDMQKTEAKVPTCTETGNREYWICSRCKKAFADQNGQTAVNPKDQMVPALGHDYSDWTTKDPTCTENGSMERTCTREDCDAAESKVIAATGHTYISDQKEATCTEDGYTREICAVCKEEKPGSKQVVNAGGHDFGEWEITEKATCILNGEKSRTCSKCNFAETEVIRATGHTKVSETKAPTCTTDGYTQITCSNCKEVLTYTIKPALGHKLSEAVTKTEPTCTEEGEKVQTCQRDGCGYTVSERVEALGHDFKSDSKEATCTETGYKREICTREGCGVIRNNVIIPATGHGFGEWTTTKEATCVATGMASRTCEKCDETQEKELPKTDHSWKMTVIKQPTETSEGIQALICENEGCGIEKDGSRETIPMLGHTYSGWSITKEATCTEDGSRTRSCTDANCAICRKLGTVYVQTEVIPATGHDLEGVNWEMSKIPSCTEEGELSRTCKTCNKKVETMRLQMAEHTFGAEAGTQPTCTTDGWVWPKCTLCGYEDTNAKHKVPATGHTYGKSEYLIEPTCTSEGLIVSVCQNEGCKARRMAVAPELPHTWEKKAEIRKAATCTQEGLKDIRCINCQEVKPGSSETIPKTDHSWKEEYSIDKAATCTSAGQKSKHCSVCDTVNQKTIEIIPATGHVYGEAVTTRQATCTVDGIREKTCRYCGDTVTESIPKTGHNMQIMKKKEPDCLNDGLVIYVCGNSGCGKLQYTVLGAYGHDFVTQTPIPATDTENGREYQKCSRCKEEETLRWLPSLNQQRKIDTVEAFVKDEAEFDQALESIASMDEEIVTTELLSSMESKIAAPDEQPQLTGDLRDGASVVGGTIAAATAKAVAPQLMMLALVADSQEDNVADVDRIKIATAGDPGTDADGKLYQKLDISLILATDSQEEPAEMKELSTPLVVTMKVPGDIAKTTDFRLERIMENGEKQNVAYTTNADGTFTFKTSNLADLCLTAGRCTGDHALDGQEMKTDPASCTKDGKKYQNCAICGAEVTSNIIPATGHSWELEETTPATCVKSGEKVYRCNNPDCSETKTENYSADHTYGWKVTTPATCTTEGVETSYCTVCEEKFEETRQIPAAKHVFEKWKVEVPATCTAEGKRVSTCENCGATSSETIPMTAHTYVEEIKGQGNGYYVVTNTCSVCNASSTKVAKETEHSSEIKRTEATCEKEGSEITICSRCGDQIGEPKVLPKKNHTLAETAQKNPTCLETGRKAYWTCTTCHQVFADAAATQPTTSAALTIPAAGHQLTQTPAKAATCVAEGTRGYWTCGTCGKVFADQAGTIETTVASQVLGKVAHAMDGYVETVHPTALAAGVKTRTCSVCGYAENAEVAKLVSNVKLTTSKLPLQIKQKAALSKIVTGMAEGDYIASAASANKKIATVDNKGNVKGVKAGKTTVTLNFASGTSRTVTIVVQKKKVATSKLTVSERNVTLKVKGKRTLMALISPITSKDKVTYKTSNKKVATVSKKGVITAKKAGKAVITVKAGKKTVKVKVKVTK